MICISKRAINFHPLISIKANSITSHYNERPRTVVQLVKKNWVNDNFFLRRVLCSNLKRTCRLNFFRKCMRPAMQICNSELKGLILGMRKTAEL